MEILLIKNTFKHYIPVYKNNNANANSQLGLIIMNNINLTKNRGILCQKDFDLSTVSI